VAEGLVLVKGSLVVDSRVVVKGRVVVDGRGVDRLGLFLLLQLNWNK